MGSSIVKHFHVSMRPLVTSVCLALFVITPIAWVSLGAAHGGPASAKPSPLVVWDCEAAAAIPGVQVTTADAKSGNGAVVWRNHPAHPALSVPNVPKDWTGYHELRYWLYSAKAVPARVTVIISSENPATKGEDYWGYTIALNFVGWKQIVLPVGGPGGTRSPRGWDNVDGITLTAAGWGNTPHPEADLRLDQFELVVNPPRPGPGIDDAEFFAQLDLSRPDLAAVKEAVGRADMRAAKEAMLRHMRDRATPKWWFDWRERPSGTVPVKGGSEGWDYFGTAITINFEGWKQFTIPLSQFKPSRKPIGWQHINKLSFSATYGDRKPKPDTRLAFDDIRLEGAAPQGLGDFEASFAFDAWRGLVPLSGVAKSGKQSGLWTNPAGGVACEAVPRDWTPWAALSFWLWSGKATGDRITIICESETPDVRAAENVCRHIHGGFFVGERINWQANKLPPTEPAFTREWTYGLNRFPDWNALGDAYWRTGDEKYAKEWIAQMRSWIEDNPLPRYSTGNETLTWRTIEAGIRTSGTWPDALCRFLGSPSLTADDLVTFLKSWIEHARHLMRITVEHPEHEGNWVTMECNGLGHLGILLPECRDAALWRKTAIDRLSAELDRQVYPDGAQKELTTGYHQVSLRNFVGLLRLAHLNAVDMPPQYQRLLERMYDYNLRVMTPEGFLPPLNDAGPTAVMESLREGAGLFGREDFLWAATRGVEGRRPEATSVALPYAGWYVMRSGWGTEDKYLHFEAGPYGIGHQHEDKLTLFIWALGRTLLTEGGVYSYDQSKWRRHVLGTWSHNTIIVDGQEQHRRGLKETYETAAPCRNLWVTTPEFDAADGAYDRGYGPKHEVKMVHHRTVVFVKPDYWVVVDRLEGAGKHDYDILWHLDSNDADRDPETGAAWGTEPRAANLQVTPAPNPALTLEIVKGREDPVLGWGLVARRQPRPCLDYKVRAEGPVTLAWALTPFRDSRPAVAIRCIAERGSDVVTVTGPWGVDTLRFGPLGEPDRVRVARAPK